MEQKKPITHIAAGGIIAAALIIFFCIVNFTNSQASGINWLQYLVIVGGLALFIYLYGKAMNNQVSFGNLFAYGFKTTAFVTLIVIAFNVIFFLAFPEFKEKNFEIVRQRLEEKGNLTPDEIDKQIQMGHKMFWVGLIGLGMLGMAIIGAIGSLIGAAITPKKPVNPVDQLDMR